MDEMTFTTHKPLQRKHPETSKSHKANKENVFHKNILERVKGEDEIEVNPFTK